MDLDEKTFFYTTEEQLKALGDREEREEVILGNDSNIDPQDREAKYTGEWLVGTETRQGWGTL